MAFLSQNQDSVPQLVIGPTNRSTIPAPIFIPCDTKAWTRGTLAVEQIYMIKPKLKQIPYLFSSPISHPLLSSNQGYA